MRKCWALAITCVVSVGSSTYDCNSSDFDGDGVSFNGSDGEGGDCSSSYYCNYRHINFLHQSVFTDRISHF